MDDVLTLLDTESAVNTISEELVVALINLTRREYVRVDSEDFPIVEFERWDDEQVVSGIARGKSTNHWIHRGGCEILSNALGWADEGSDSRYSGKGEATGME